MRTLVFPSLKKIEHFDWENQGRTEYCACRAISVSSLGANFPVLELDPGKALQISSFSQTEQPPSYHLLVDYEILCVKRY